MTLTVPLRKVILTAHITFSVGWLGAAGAFLVLSIAGLTSHDREVVRSAYLSMNLIGLYLIVPLSLVALATGLIQALGTHWGLVRQYWVVAKFLLTILAIYALLMHQFTAVEDAAKLVSERAAPTFLSAELRLVGTELLSDVSGALLVLLVVTALAVYKPWGLTRYGRRKEQRSKLPQLDDKTPAPLKFKILLAVIAALVVVFKIALYLSGHNMHHGH